jgi:hypothetical protein
MCSCSQFSVGAFEANETYARNTDLMGKYLDLTGMPESEMVECSVGFVWCFLCVFVVEFFII